MHLSATNWPDSHSQPTYPLKDVSINPYIASFTQNHLKVSIGVGEVLTPICVKFWVSQTSDIMIRTGVVEIHVDEQAVVVNYDSVIGGLYFFPTIEPFRVIGIFVGTYNLHTGVANVPHDTF